MNLNSLFTSAKSGLDKSNAKLPPVHLWNPESCGDIDIYIDREGFWFHEGTRITRQALVDLFSSILKREGDDYFLVTPQEKCRIRVEVAPLKIVSWEIEHANTEEQRIQFQTEQGAVVALDKEHPLSLLFKNKEGYPIVHIRNQLDALVSRNVYYQMSEHIEEFNLETLDANLVNQNASFDSSAHKRFLGIRSHGMIFPLTASE